MNEDGQLQYRLLLAVDIAAYSKRDAREQLRTQRDLADALDRAAADVGADRGRWEKQVGGDGELAILPEDADVPSIAGAFPLRLMALLHAINDRNTNRPALRVRVALHHGTLTAGPFGPAGDAPITVQRLLDAGALRKQLVDQPDRAVAYAVSASLYEDVVRTGFTELDPAAFEPVRLVAKGATFRGFVYTGDERAAGGAAADLPPLIPRPRHGGNLTSHGGR